MKKKPYEFEEEITIASEPAVAYASSPLRIIKDMGRDDKHGFLSIVKEGVSYDTMMDFCEMANIHLEELAKILHVTSRTIRRLDTEAPLNIDISEKVLELLRLYTFGIEIFGSKEVFNTWMRRSVAGLGNITPFSLLDTGIGIEIIIDELERLAYGVYS